MESKSGDEKENEKLKDHGWSKTSFRRVGKVLLSGGRHWTFHNAAEVMPGHAAMNGGINGEMSCCLRKRALEKARTWLRARVSLGEACGAQEICRRRYMTGSGD